jgi:hypothetical protein
MISHTSRNKLKEWLILGILALVVPFAMLIQGLARATSGAHALLRLLREHS